MPSKIRAPNKVSAWCRFDRSAARTVKRSRLCACRPAKSGSSAASPGHWSKRPQEPDGRALYRAVYAEETPVGFVMISDEVGTPDYIPRYLWKVLIDERYQGQGFGTATLDLIDDEVLLRLNLR
jgi:GNAT superfamily N-acetyltransferase